MIPGSSPGRAVLLRSVLTAELRRNKRARQKKDVLLIEPPLQMRKMSEVVLEFAEPLLEDIHLMRGIENYDRAEKNIVTFSILAWNAALFPEGKRQEIKQKMIATLMPSNAPMDFAATMDRWFDRLIERKQKDYPEENRAVVDWEFSGSGGTLRLNVLSLLPSNEMERWSLGEVEDLWKKKSLR